MQNRRTTKIPYLDGWRGLAIVTVLIAHFQPQYLSWLGSFGVQLFFVLSGYLMGGLLFIKEVPLKDFFVRRFSRVLPTFAVFVCVMAIYAATFQFKPYSVPPTELLSTLAFARTYFPANISINSGAWPIGHVWSLNVEEHSYFLLAVGALVARVMNRKTVALVFLWSAVVTVLFFNVCYQSNPPIGASAWHRRSEAAALGLLAAAALRVTATHFDHRWLRLKRPVAVLLTFAAAFACYFINELRPNSISLILKYSLAPLLLACSVNQLAYAPIKVQHALSARALCWFGTASFSLYLWQQPFYYAHAAYGVPVLPALVGALLCGTLSFYCWENPLRIYLNAKWEARQSAGIIGSEQSTSG